MYEVILQAAIIGAVLYAAASIGSYQRKRHTSSVQMLHEPIDPLLTLPLSQRASSIPPLQRKDTSTGNWYEITQEMISNIQSDYTPDVSGDNGPDVIHFGEHGSSNRFYDPVNHVM